MEDEFVFCTVKDGRYGDYTELSPIATFCEAEGLTLVLPKYRADKAGFRYESVFKGITLTVHSSLDAVGLTAVVSSTLAEHGISANVIAAYYHDHIFVQSERADEALAALSEFSPTTG
jgi:hypothetical protein